jgi:hypothetical protein
VASTHARTSGGSLSHSWDPALAGLDLFLLNDRREGSPSPAPAGLLVLRFSPLFPPILHRRPAPPVRFRGAGRHGSIAVIASCVGGTVCLLRDNEPTFVVARYILENPVRAGLAASVEEYPFVGSSEYTLSELIASAYASDQSG